MKLCSACLLGVRCTYDGKERPNPKIIELSKKEKLIPVCPEQLGGMSTPREKIEIRGGKVFTESGKDVTEISKRGAEEVLRIARVLGVKEFIGRHNSPSCGCGKTYDGTFSHTIIEGNGITAELLKENGIKIIPEEEL